MNSSAEPNPHPNAKREDSRRPAPEVKEEVDRRWDGNALDASSAPRPQSPPREAAPIEPNQAEPRPFHQIVDYQKLQFGQALIGWCIFLIVTLSLIGYYEKGADGNRNELSSALELLKLVTTTALGFVFAKTQFSPQGMENENSE